MPLHRPQLRKVLEERPGLRRSRVFSHRPAASEPAAPQAGLDGARRDWPSEILDEQRLRIEERHEEGLHTLVLIGALELRSVDSLEAALSRLRSKPATSLTVDLSQLTFIDSSGLWTITSLQKLCSREGIGFTLIPGPEPVHQVFELTGLSDVLPFATEAAATDGR